MALFFIKNGICEPYCQQTIYLPINTAAVGKGVKINQSVTVAGI